MTAPTTTQPVTLPALAQFIRAHEPSVKMHFWFNGPDSDEDDPAPTATALIDCGTTACAAGWTCILAGDKFLDSDNVQTPEGDREDAMYRAQELLGLDDDERDNLFLRTKTAEDALAYIDELIEARA